MLLFALALSLTPAHAQSKSATKAEILAFERYVGLHGALDKLSADRGGVPKIDAGMVNIMDLKGELVGHVWAEQSGGNKRREHWFISDELFWNDPGAGFTLSLVDETIISEDAARDYLDEHAKGWGSEHYYFTDLIPVEMPPPSTTNGLVAVLPMIERYSFTVQRDGLTVGAMLREVYLTASFVPISHTEHWVFFEDVNGDVFSGITAKKDALDVLPDAVPFVAPADFFTNYSGQTDKRFVMPAHELDGVGSDF